MNLKQIRDQIAFILDYDPDRQQYTDDLTEVINRNYLDLFGREDFSFAQKEAALTVRKSVSASDGSVANGSYILETSSDFFVVEQMDGMILYINEVEYQIAWVQTARRVHLTKAYAGSTLIGTASLRVEYRFIDLPEDCVRILDVFRREPNNPEQMLPLSRSDEGLYAIDFKEQGEPIMWMPVDDFSIQPPRTTNFQKTTGALTYGVRTLEFALAFGFANKISGLSKVTEFELATNEYVTFTIDALPQRSGLMTYVYARNKEYSNKWFLVPSTGNTIRHPPSTAPLTYAYNLPAADWNNAFEVEHDNLPESEGSYKRMRMYPLQDDDYTVYVRYAYRPKKLVDDYDTPDFDAAYHKVLVFMAVREAFAKMNNASMAGMYASKVKNEMQKLSNGFLSQRQQRWIKNNGSFPHRRRASKLVTGDFGTLP